MALTAKQLVNAELALAIGTLYAVPASTKTRVTEILLCNNAGAARTVTMHFVESGDTAGDDNGIMKAFSLPQGVPMVFPMNTWLETGDLIRGFASGADVACIISGIEEA